MPKMNISFSPPDISELEIQQVTEAMRSGWITTGPKTKLFEQKLAEYCGTPRCVCVNSATAAMELILRVLGVGPGDEVITSAYTYTASASIIDHVGAKIVFVDTAPDSFMLDYDKLADAITERTKVVIPVDIGGVMADYDKVFAAVESRKHLYRPSTDLQRAFDRPVVLADAAHSLGATYHWKMCGSVADFTSFSFHAVKNLTTAEGGAITWLDHEGIDNVKLYQELQLLSLHGQNKDALSKMKLGSWEYDIVCTGYKCNMTDMTAGFGLAQLQRFPSLTAKRMKTIAKYDEVLLPLGIKRLDHNGEDYKGNGHLYLVRVPGISEAQRNEIIVKMSEQGIACNVHFKPLPMMTAYKRLGFDVKDFPNAYAQYRNEITLPTHTRLSDAEIEYVAHTLKSILTGNGNESFLESDCEVLRVWENDDESIECIYKLFKDCGDQMFLDEGLLHWADPLPISTIKAMCREQEVYVVKDRALGSTYAFFAYTDHPSQFFDVDKRCVYLERIAVMPTMWRHGLGRMCMDMVEKYALVHRCSAIRTSVYDKSKGANAFFESHGYVRLYTRPTKNFIVNCIEKTL